MAPSKKNQKEKQRIECGSAADERIAKKQCIEQEAFDMQQKADELASKQAARIERLESKYKVAIAQCGWLSRRVTSYKKVVQELMAANEGEYTGPYGDNKYAVPSISQMQKINVDLRSYDAILQVQQLDDEVSVSVEDDDSWEYTEHVVKVE